MSALQHAASGRRPAGWRTPTRTIIPSAARDFTIWRPSNHDPPNTVTRRSIGSRSPPAPNNPIELQAPTGKLKPSPGAALAHLTADSGFAGAGPEVSGQPLIP
jgi:hypothetical protein